MAQNVYKHHTPRTTSELSQGAASNGHSSMPCATMLYQNSIEMDAPSAIVVPLDSLPEDVERPPQLREQIEQFHALYGPYPVTTTSPGELNDASSNDNLDAQQEATDAIGAYVHVPRTRRESVTASFPMGESSANRISSQHGSSANTMSMTPSRIETTPMSTKIQLIGHAEVLTDSTHNKDVVVLAVDTHYMYVQLLQMHSCYDVLAISNRLVALDINLPLNKAFYALVFNSARMALLWDPSMGRFVGCISNTDFIHALMTFERALALPLEMSSPSSASVCSDGPKSPETGSTSSSTAKRRSKPDDRVAHSKIIDAYLKDRTVEEWMKELENAGLKRPLYAVSAKASVLQAAQIMHKHHLYRLVVYDEVTSNPLAIINHSRILRFLFHHADRMPPPLFQQLPRDAGIGSWHQLHTVTLDTPLWDCMRAFLEHDISGLPVLSSDNTVIDVYSRFDVISLAYNDATFDLHSTDMRTALLLKNMLRSKDKAYSQQLITCTTNDTVARVVSTLNENNVYRVIVLDAKTRQLAGIITASDLIRYLVLKPAHECLQRQLSPRTPADVPVLTMPVVAAVSDTPTFSL